MSVDYYLVSRKHKRAAQVGSIGFSGIQSYPGCPDGVAFIRWAIDQRIEEPDLKIELLTEHEYEALEESLGKFTEEN